MQNDAAVENGVGDFHQNIAQRDDVNENETVSEVSIVFDTT